MVELEKRLSGLEGSKAENTLNLSAETIGHGGEAASLG